MIVRALARRASANFLPLVWLVVVAAPIYYMLATSLRSPTDYLGGNPWLPSAWTLQNFTQVLSGRFPTYFINSVIVTGACVAIQIPVALLAAFGISRGRPSTGVRALGLLLVGLAIPVQAALIPLFFIMTRIYLYDTLAAVILPIVAFNIPITVLILSTYLRDIPRDLYDAMEMDGAGPSRTLLSLVVPLAAPALGTVGIYNALSAWNSFIFPLILTQSTDARVLPVGLFDFKNDHGVAVPAMMAAVFLSTAPLLVAYLIGRRQLLRGLAAVGS
jgi:xylobiose transport system permease protein